MGKVGGLLGAVAFGVIGGFVGGLFAPGAFSMLGASIGFTAGGALMAPKPAFQSSKPEIVPEDGEVFIRQFAGSIQNVNPRVIRVGKDKKGNPAGVFVKTKSSSGKGGTTSSQTFLLMCEMEIGRAMAPDALYIGDEYADESPEPLFVDLLEMEDADGRETIYDRSGETEDERGIELTQTISSITGRVIKETSENGKITFFTGTDEQMPFAPMEEFYPDGLPADRGIAKISFNRFPVKSAPTFYVTVRSGTNGRRQLLTLKFGEAGIEESRLVLDAIPEDSVFKGVSIEGFTPLREFAERATRRLFCDWAFDGARLVVQSRVNPTIHNVDMRRVGVWRDSGGDEGGAQVSDDGRLVLRARAQTDMCSEVRITFPNSNQNGESDVAPAPQSRAQHQNVLSYDLGEVESMQLATKFAYALRDEDWNSDEEGQFSVLPGCENWLAGDVVSLERGKNAAGQLLPRRNYLILELEREPSGIQNAKIVPWAAHVYEQPINAIGPVAPKPKILLMGAPFLGAVDCVALNDEQVDDPGILLWVALRRTQKQRRVEYRLGYTSKLWDGDYTTRENATCGVLTSAFDPATDSEISLKSIRGELTSASDSQYRQGGNVMVFDNGLVLQFKTAYIEDYDADEDEIFYTISDLSGPRFGSEYAANALTSGAKWVLFKDASNNECDGVFWKKAKTGAIGRNDVRISSFIDPDKNSSYSNVYLNYRARNMEALPPVVVDSIRDDGDLVLRGRSRTRYAEDNYQSDASLHRLSETPTAQGWKFHIKLNALSQTKRLDLYSNDERAGFDFRITSATLISLFGEVPSEINGTIQMQGKYGLGREAAFDANEEE
jgi:hypothetical protein